MFSASFLFVAMILDAILGEPDWLWRRFRHPATLMGRWVEWFDGRFNHGNNRKQKGVLVMLALVAGGAVAGWAIAAIPDRGVLEIIIAAILLAQRSLTEHVQQVADALREGLPQGRRAVSMIVGRDPEALDQNGVARGAIESAAENFSDGVIAPAFWFFLFGLPGIIVYKLVNTADSMIGYRNERYEQFGWAAARLDDVMNWVPARITGGLICLAYWSEDAWRVMQADARLHRSPNAGWPEAAMAGVLGVALAGPRSYDGEMRDLAWVNPEGRKTLTPMDIERAVSVLWRSWFVAAAIVGAAAVFG